MNINNSITQKIDKSFSLVELGRLTGLSLIRDYLFCTTDISNKYNPVQLDSLSSSTYNGAAGLHIHGNVAFFVH